MKKRVEAQCTDCGNWWRVPLDWVENGPLDSCPMCVEPSAPEVKEGDHAA